MLVYRLHIQRLLLFHNDNLKKDFQSLQLFNSGFFGVDIFFVISGYLITSIILRELVTTGTFSFKYFYERRIRRILPALILVMLVSFPFAWKYIIPGSFIDFSKSILVGHLLPKELFPQFVLQSLLFLSFIIATFVPIFTWKIGKK